MKKVFLALAAIATIASFTACTKTCSCTTYLGNQVQKTEEVELDGDHKNCSELSTLVTIANVKSGVECL